jgi:hypothetical protein
LAKNSSFIFLSVGFLWLEKMNVLFVRLAFLVQKLMFSTFFRIMHNGLGYEQLRGLARTFASTRQAENSAGIFRISL